MPTWRGSTLRTSGSSLRSALALVTLTLSLAGTAAAQDRLVVTGRVLRATGTDTIPLNGAWVVLHGVSALGGAPVDSARADWQGGYRIEAARDSGAAYITSVRYAGVAYFGAPFGPPAPGAEAVGPIVVFDTSSTEPPVTLVERRVVVLRPEVDGSRRIVEYLRLANGGDRTRVSGGDDAPTWSGTVSSEPRDFQAGPGDVTEEAIAFAGGTVSVYAPIPPGERDLLFSYVVPPDARRVVLPTDQAVGAFEVLLEDEAADVEAGLLRFDGYETLSGLMFRAYRADEVAPGAGVTILLPRDASGGTESWLLWIVVPAALLAMAGALTLWTRRAREPGLAPAAEETPERLAARIAALDAEHAGREDADYRARRAELKARLTDALARAPRRR